MNQTLLPEGDTGYASALSARQCALYSTSVCSSLRLPQGATAGLFSSVELRPDPRSSPLATRALFRLPPQSFTKSQVAEKEY